MEKRALIGSREFSWKSFFLQWEWMLVLIFILVNVINATLSPYYLNGDSLRDATMTFLDKAFIVLPMVFIIILGDIDISVGSIVALSSVVMADLYTKGVPMEIAMVICLLTGTLCGFVNGLLITKFKELSAVIVTLATMIITAGSPTSSSRTRRRASFPNGSATWGGAMSDRYRLSFSSLPYSPSPLPCCFTKRLLAGASMRWAAI